MPLHDPVVKHILLQYLNRALTQVGEQRWGDACATVRIARAFDRNDATQRRFATILDHVTEVERLPNPDATATEHLRQSIEGLITSLHGSDPRPPQPETSDAITPEDAEEQRRQARHAVELKRRILAKADEFVERGMPAYAMTEIRRIATIDPADTLIAGYENYVRLLMGADVTAD